MPINVFGSSSNISERKIDTSLIVQKLHLRTIYIESNFEENFDLEDHFRIKNLPDAVSRRGAASKNYVDNKFSDPSTTKNTDHVDFNDKNLNNVHSIKINSFPTLEEHLTLKIYVDQTISNGVGESSLLRLDPNEKLYGQDSYNPNSSLTIPKTIKNYLHNHMLIED